MKLTTPTVKRLTGASERRLRYWAETGLIKPSAKQTGHRLYTFLDVVAIRTIVSLLDGGCSLQRIRRAVRHLQARFKSQTTETLASQTLLTDGDTVYLLSDVQKIMEVLSGQAVMHTVCLGPLIAETFNRAKTLRFQWTERVKVRSRNYTLVISHDPDDEGYTVQCRELPGAIEPGDTPAEAEANGRAAIESVLDFIKKHRRKRVVVVRARS